MVELDFTGSLASKRNVVSSMTFHANYKLAERLGKDPVLSPQKPRLHWWELLAGSWLQSVSTALAARTEKRFLEDDGKEGPDVNLSSKAPDKVRKNPKVSILQKGTDLPMPVQTFPS
ncbi:hypothetical protein TURU_166288 [Turdus rufiventris]|nr:hypothetical protein TURU_166288 [Turdus rufiventris]